LRQGEGGGRTPCTAWPAARCCRVASRVATAAVRPAEAPRGRTWRRPSLDWAALISHFPVPSSPAPNPKTCCLSHPPRCGCSIPAPAYFSSRSSRSSTVPILSRLSLSERYGTPRRDAEAAAALSPNATIDLACAYLCSHGSSARLRLRLHCLRHAALYAPVDICAASHDPESKR
jgi:hypothetical protein